MVRDAVLEVVKRRALRVLHKTPEGEAVLLGVYLAGEEQAESAVLLDAVVESAPLWLARSMERHRADEQRHAGLFRARLVAIGAEPTAPALDPVSAWKLRRLRALGPRFSHKFRAGISVPLLAVAWRMEVMGVRVFARHVEVLEARGGQDATLSLLRNVLADERRHEASAKHSLDRLLGEDEGDRFQALVREVDAIERSFGITGAFLLLAMGGWLWLKTATRSFISRSPTPAGT